MEEGRNVEDLEESPKYELRDCLVLKLDNSSPDQDSNLHAGNGAGACWEGRCANPCPRHCLIYS